MCNCCGGWCCAREDTRLDEGHRNRTTLFDLLGGFDRRMLIRNTVAAGLCGHWLSCKVKRGMSGGQVIRVGDFIGC